MLFDLVRKVTAMTVSRVMGTWIVALCVTVMAIGCGGSSTPDEENRGLLRITEFSVKPDRLAMFEAAWKQNMARYEQAGSSFGFSVSVSDSDVYRVVRPMGSWARFEQYRQEQQALPGEFPREAFGDSIDHVRSSVLRTRQDLNYLPENPRFAGNQLGNEEYGFIKYFFIHTRPGTGQQVADVLRRMNEVRQRHDVDTPVIVTSSVQYHDGPMVLLRIHFRDVADSFTHRDEYMAAMGEEFQVLLDEMSNLTRHITASNNVVRRDLSYQPAN